MEIELYESGKAYLEKDSNFFNRSEYANKLKYFLDNIESFDNQTFIIRYDNLRIISYQKNMYVFGYTLNMDEAITDLFYRNILFDKIFTKNVRFINRLKKLFNYKIMIDNDHYRVCQRNIRRTLFSGGCFWCMAHPYYTFDGVIKVLSGYAGGTSLNPTYLETKKGNGYLETVLIVYDSNKISYSDLLKLYFESIDPFDTEGQFIDKGYSYTTQVYLKTKNEITCFEEYKKKIEDLYKMKVSVKKHGDALFYVAEDEHQEFEFKNKEKFLKEEEESGRNNFSYVKI